VLTLIAVGWSEDLVYIPFVARRRSKPRALFRAHSVCDYQIRQLRHAELSYTVSEIEVCIYVCFMPQSGAAQGNKSNLFLLPRPATSSAVSAGTFPLQVGEKIWSTSQSALEDLESLDAFLVSAHHRITRCAISSIFSWRA